MISLSLMVLLTVLAVGLLSLSTISLRAGSHGDAMAVAKANARMSLALAIGELQKLSGPDQRYLHNFVRYWVSPKNDRAVTLIFQYQSKGAEFRTRPDDDNQFVALIQHWTPNAEGFFADIDVQCQKAPNSAMDGDTVRYALRAPHGARHRER